MVFLRFQYLTMYSIKSLTKYKSVGTSVFLLNKSKRKNMALSKAKIKDNYFEYLEIDSFFYKLVISKIISLDLTPNEFTLLIYITNQTIGFRDEDSNKPKRWDYIAKYLLEDKIKSSRRPTEKALKTLEELNLISVYRDASSRRSNTTAKFNAYSLSEDFMDIVNEQYSELTGSC